MGKPCLLTIINSSYLSIYQLEMNFDDDDIDIGYTPSVVNNSRSAGMKKMVRKPDSSKPKPPAPPPTKQADDFDLLDELLSPAKPKPANKSSKQVASFKNDDIDSFFDQPSTITVSKNKTATVIPNADKPKLNDSGWNDWGDSKGNSKIETTFNSAASNSRPQTAKVNAPLQFDDIIEETTSPKPSTSSFKFKRPETATPASQKQEIIADDGISVSPSLRMMKPPLRRKDSKEDGKRSQMNKSGGFGLVLAPSQPKSAFIEQKSHLTLPTDNMKNEPLPTFSKRQSVELQRKEPILKLEEEKPFARKFDERGRPPALTIEQPTSILNNKSNRVSLRLDSPQNQKKEATNKLWEGEKSYLIQDDKSNFQSQNYNNQTLKIDSHSQQSQHHQQSQEKQLQFIKASYQKHIDSLQKTLQDQLKSNQQSRDHILKEANAMIESERRRLKQIHQQEVDRIKQMGEWEKKKMEESYQLQITSLRTQLDRATAQTIPSNSYGFTSSNSIDKKEIQYLEDSLRAQRKSLEEREKLLERRELALEQNERQLTKKKRLQQERLRDEEKRIFQAQMENKKIIFQQRRDLEEQKQAIAVQLASLQLGNFKKIENAENLAAELHAKKAELEKQKKDMRALHNQVMQDYKRREEELRKDKQRVSRLQSELVQKLRVVEAKTMGRDSSAGHTKVNKTLNYKQNNWTHDNAEQTHHHKAMSAQKIDQHKKLQKTQNRFLQIAETLKDNMKVKGVGGFDIDNYLLSMGKYSRTKDPIC